MEQLGRVAFCQMVEARIAEWEKNITLLGHRMAKAKEDPELIAKVAEMKGKLPALAEKPKIAMDIADDRWSDFKSEVDLMFENLTWLQKFVLRRLGGA
jgi:hypothetical protein